MTRKLPALKARQVVRALERAGFRLVRQKGSHQIFEHPERPELRVTVPDHGSHDLKTGTMASILKQCGMSAEEFAKFL